MNTEIESYYSYGKLLLTGEYAVVNGALALAVPLMVGQSLKVRFEPSDHRLVKWKAIDPERTWMDIDIEIPDLPTPIHEQGDLAVDGLIHYLNICRKLNPRFMNPVGVYHANSRLDFNHKFGWGSSSSLISNLGWWADLDPFKIHFQAHPDSSGYDIAAARMNNPFLYRTQNGIPTITPVALNYPFTENLVLVYLGKKQSTAASMKWFRNLDPFTEEEIQRISDISITLPNVSDPAYFTELLREHESILSQKLGLPPVSSHFRGFEGVVKSLGAWGGDFILAVSPAPPEEISSWFQSRGYPTIFRWKDLVPVQNDSPLKKDLA